MENLKLTLYKEFLLEELLTNILDNHVDDLDENQKAIYVKADEALKTYCGKNLTENNEQFITSINESLNSCVQILTELEADGLLNEEEKKEFDSDCEIIVEIEEIKKFIGETMVIFQGSPYLLNKVDLDELDLEIWDGVEWDGSFWVKPSECKLRE